MNEADPVLGRDHLNKLLIRLGFYFVVGLLVPACGGGGGGGGGGGSQGTITPALVLASGLSVHYNWTTNFVIGELRLDGGRLYWFEYDPTIVGPNGEQIGGSIKWVTTHGSEERIVVSGLPYIVNFEVDSFDVFWAEGSSVKKASTEGFGPVTVLASGYPLLDDGTISTLPVWPVSLQIDLFWVYWGQTGGGGVIRKIRKFGSSEVTELGRGKGFWSVNVISPFHFYGVANGGTGIVKMDVSGTTMSDVTSEPLNNVISPLIENNTYLYFAEMTGSGRIGRVSSGGGPITVFDRTAYPRGIAADLYSIYYSASSGASFNELYKVPTASGSPSTLIRCEGGFGLPFTPTKLAVDNRYLYILDAPYTVNAPGANVYSARLLRVEK